MKKRSFFALTIVFTFVSLFFVSNQSQGQYFNKYYTWASEKHIEPGANFQRLPFRYDSIKYALKGTFSGMQSHSVDIPALCYITKNNLNRLLVFTVESKGFNIIDPLLDYGRADVVNAQENLNLDLYQHTNSDGTIDSVHAFTERPTLQRFIDQNNTLPNFDSIKFTLCGNFYGSGRDEIAIIYAASPYYQPLYFLKVNQTNPALNYQFEIKV